MDNISNWNGETRQRNVQLLLTRRKPMTEEKKFFLINYDEFKPVGVFGDAASADVVGQKSKFKYLVVGKPEDLEKFPLKSLNALSSNCEGEGEIKDRKVGAQSVFELLNKLKLETPALPQKRRAKKSNPDKPKTKAKSTLLREAFEGEKKCYKKDELTELTGYDERNLYTMVSILKNPKRTPQEKLLEILYDKATGCYYMGEENKPVVEMKEEKK